MALIIGIKFKNTGKTYSFSPKDIVFEKGDGVILETARGMEYGVVSVPNRVVNDEEIVAPLKEVIRKANEEDLKKHLENLSERESLMQTVKEKVESHSLKMKIVDVEYTFDRSKIIVYFTAASRIDFRDLVKDLASVFHLRIELRQIYERDDIKMRGALGVCGRLCCCTTHLQDFEKVSIRMAKRQGLSLNPSKISGCCGKLMCCLNYEDSYYSKASKEMPKVQSSVKTPDGKGIVLHNDLLNKKSKIKVTLADDTNDIRIYPLEDLQFKKQQIKSEINEEVE